MPSTTGVRAWGLPRAMRRGESCGCGRSSCNQCKRTTTLGTGCRAERRQAEGRRSHAAQMLVRDACFTASQQRQTAASLRMRALARARPHVCKRRKHVRHLVRDAQADAARRGPSPHKANLAAVVDGEAGQAGAAGLRRPVYLLVADWRQVAREPGKLPVPSIVVKTGCWLEHRSQLVKQVVLCTSPVCAPVCVPACRSCT
jgi:hypothetical protein